MKIEISVTQEELDEMNIGGGELHDYIVESLNSGGPSGDIELAGYDVYVEVEG